MRATKDRTYGRFYLYRTVKWRKGLTHASLPHAFLSRRLRLPILALVPLALLALPRLSSRALWATPLAAPLAAPSAASFAAPSAAM